MSRILTKADRKAAIDEARIRKLAKLFIRKRDEMIASRLEKQPISKANRYTILNEEHRLRNELELGHPVDRRDRITGRAILTEAVAAGHFNIVRMLIHEYDVHIGIPTMLGQQTPLHLAVVFGHRQIASILITYGADVNCRDVRGCTPLHMVRHMPLAKLLFKFEVDPLLTTSDENLRPSEYYLKYVPKEEQLTELFTFLSLKESRREAENNQLRLRTAREGKREKERERVQTTETDMSEHGVVESNI